jgi:hypothetical protein
VLNLGPYCIVVMFDLSALVLNLGGPIVDQASSNPEPSAEPTVTLGGSEMAAGAF